MPDPAEGADPGQQQQEDPTPKTADDKFDPDKWRVFQESMRKSEEGLKKEAEDAKRALKKHEEDVARKAKEAEDAKLTAEQKTAQRLEELEKQLQGEREARRKLQTAASISAAVAKTKPAVPDVVEELVRNRVTEYEEDGTPKGLDAILTDLKKSHALLWEGTPQRRGPGSADGGARSPAPRDVQPGLDRIRAAYETAQT